MLLLCSPLAIQPAYAQEDEDNDLRERLTEREDETRIEQPLVVDFLGRPLTFTGQWESAGEYISSSVLGMRDGASDRLLIESEIEVELFYSFGSQLSLFAQLRLIAGRDIYRDASDPASEYFIERGEMWVYTQDIGGTGLDLQAGRLDFEDDGQWWWDTDLDAVRLSRESEDFEIAIAVAREVMSARSDRRYIEPDQDGINRLFVEVAWDWDDQHAVEGYALWQRDTSATSKPGQQTSIEREDDSDANLTWAGLRAVGAWAFETGDLVGYWINTAQVRGSERIYEFGETDSPGISVVEDSSTQNVSGWAIDTGITWIMSLRRDPRLTFGYAYGSGDSDPVDRVDRNFRQTGLQANETGFGGVERFAYYGALLDPELSNLSILTLAAGLSVFSSSSIDLVYHRYRMNENSDSLGDSRIDSVLTGQDRDLGQELDLIVAIEESQRFEFEFVGSVFLPGSAYGEDRKKWTWGGYLALRVAF